MVEPVNKVFLWKGYRLSRGPGGSLLLELELPLHLNLLLLCFVKEQGQEEVSDANQGASAVKSLLPT